MFFKKLRKLLQGTPSEMETIFEKMNRLHFPGGKKQIQEQTEEIVKLSNGKLDFEKAQSLLLKGKGMLSINKGRVYDFIKSNFQNVLDADELKIMTTFIIFGAVNEQTISMVNMGFNLENWGSDQDEIPSGYGEFGLCPTNPIPVNGILTNEIYLEKIRTENGEKITWERKGSGESTIKDIVGMIDCYVITDPNNNHLCEFYISPYNQKMSQKAPKGFKLVLE